MEYPTMVISIVTYNSKHIFDVLDNLKKEIGNEPNIRVAVFDNNSSNEFRNKLKQYSDFANITFYHENNGFGFGHNYNLLNADEKYFLIFNPDIIVTKENLNNMVTVMENDESIALLVPKVLNEDGTIQHLMRRRVTVFDYALRFIPFDFVKKLFAKRLATYECRDIPQDRLVDINMGSGCFMLIRGDIYKEINGFDERYFMYFEDTDLCLMLKKRNRRVVYTPFSFVVHFYERGSHKNWKLFKIFVKSMVKFFNKWGWKWI
ncbi:glycosyltransferase family 2 protein [Caldibacillus sp. 210928-DFI.2.22]|uniref:glycosyltransferase family 2 protein n=1 Tax=Caldibacillus TaxID=1276290 RepID=UPI001D05F72E|nr:MULTISPECIES: glycosyltransferase family 2 protein [Caldibacillus]MCB7070331.1 glycosyltransferase family 2 protein [Caldibacillus sp. 210928-DFI.2.22]MCB7073865.1 glycosyltransferase family 2 protein [Caldibacillus sp. 210928-DFI.2.18]MCM3476739.1 glycosyltransferase family 2 protein [Caldibacillus thermoamylovorans]